MRGIGVQCTPAHSRLALLPPSVTLCCVMWTVCKRLMWAMCVCWIVCSWYVVCAWCAQCNQWIVVCVTMQKVCVVLSIALGDYAQVTQGIHVCAHGVSTLRVGSPGTLVIPVCCASCEMCVLCVAHPWP